MEKTHNILAVSAIIILEIVSMVIATQPEQQSKTGIFVIHPKSAEAGDHAKKLATVRHEFKSGKFTAVVPEERLNQLSTLAELEPVPLYHVSGAQANTKRQASASRTCTPTAQTPWGVSRVNGGNGGAGVKVALLDTGVYTNHFDLKNKIADCKDFTKGLMIKNGCSDNNGHGTHVAGTIAANTGSDGKGIIGVAPQASLLAYKVCGNDGSCWSDDIAAAIEYAADHGANVLSMSLGGDTTVSIMRDAVDYATARNVLVIAAAGNDGPGDGTIDYPGALANVVAVAATDSTDSIAAFSSRGINYDTTPYSVEERDVEFAAPGVSIESTWNDGCYRKISGTSMATPHVSGLAASLWQGTASATRTLLQEKAKAGTDIGRAGDDPDAGFGMPVK